MAPPDPDRPTLADDAPDDDGEADEGSGLPPEGDDPMGGAAPSG